MSDKVILVTGASSGFGALAARALAEGGDTVYAGMRETRTRPTLGARSPRWWLPRAVGARSGSTS